MSQDEENNIKNILNSKAIRWLEVTVRYKSYRDYKQVKMIEAKTQLCFIAGGLRTSYDNLNTHAGMELL